MPGPNPIHTPQNLRNGNGPQSDATDDAMLNMLREILLREDRTNIADIRTQLENSDQLAEKVNPIIEIHIETLKRQFPKEYRKQVTQIVERKLKSSQDELLDVIYPVMGKMIRKYVNQQFLELKESLDQQLERLFSVRSWKTRIKAMFMGVQESEMLLRDMDKATIEEVYVIERDSGILLGHYSQNETIDRDVVAGMLTAIKSFVEDAFVKESQDLEMINYGTYNIFLHSFHRYYMAVVLDGSLSSTDKDQLSGKLLDFAEKEMAQASSHSQDYDGLSAKLATYFGAGGAKK